MMATLYPDQENPLRSFMIADEGRATIWQQPDGTFLVITQDGRRYVGFDLDDAAAQALHMLRSA